MANLDEFKLDKSKLNLDLLIRAGSASLLRRDMLLSDVLRMSMSAISAQTRSANLQALSNVGTFYMRVCHSSVCYLAKLVSRCHILGFLGVRILVRLNTRPLT